MRQFFVDETLSINQTFSFNLNQAHHISHVLRMKENDLVRIVDKNNNTFVCLLKFENNNVYGIVNEQLESKKDDNVVLIAALIKKDNWELIIQKACELNASIIVPLITNRTIIHLDEKEIDKKLERWNSIALQACQQSNRDLITEVLRPIKINQLQQYKQDINLFAYEKQNDNQIRNFISEGSISIVIGPEGGFDLTEVNKLTELGFIPVSLGNNILRAETACMYALSVINAYKD